MPKRRTTGCAQQHYAKNCPDCTRARVRRFRARHRADPTPRLPPSDEQRVANAAASYVREYVRRGAIAPPDACDRCDCDVQISPAHPLRSLQPWHPDPAQRQQVAWLCSECRRIVRATREPLTLHWTWPGISAPRSRKPPELMQRFTAALTVVESRLLPGATPAMRDAAVIATLVAELSSGERERLYAAGSLAGPRWQPTGDARLNVLLRGWVFTERTERSRGARDAGGTTVVPIALTPRRSRGEMTPPPPDPPRQPFDAEAFAAATERALERLDRADAVAEETNARVAAALRRRLA